MEAIWDFVRAAAPLSLIHIEMCIRDRHDPIMQIVGYLISGDPTYITSYNNARSLIRRLERDEILEEFVRFYREKHDEGK